MKKVAHVVAVMFLVAIVLGCASISSSRFGEDIVSGIKGKTEEQIIAQFGKPYKKYTTNEGLKVLEYRQSASDRGAVNSFAAIGSFGVMSGGASLYVDILKIYFKRKVASKATFEENVQGVTMPGM